MKQIKEYELEVGDSLYYVYKPNQHYTVMRITLTEAHFNTRLKNTIALKFENNDMLYISNNRFTNLMDPIQLYRPVPHGLQELNKSESPLLFTDQTAAMSEMIKLNQQLSQNLHISDYMNNIKAVNINDSISGRLLTTKYPRLSSELTTLAITTIPKLEEDGPVTATVYLYYGEPVSLQEYIRNIPNKTINSNNY